MTPPVAPVEVRVTHEPENAVGPPGWIWRLLGIVAILAAAALLVAATFFCLASLDKASSNLQSSRRNDCRAAINAPIAEITRRAQIQAAKTTQLFDQALLASQGGARPTPDEVAAFVDANDELLKDLVRAAKLPDDPNTIVNHGGTIDGQHFDACPKVG